MKSGYTFEFTGNYVHLNHSDDFVVNPQTIRRLWDDLAEFCNENGCKKVLAEGKVFKRKMTTVEAFESGNAVGKKILGLWLACVFPEYQPDETTDFFKTVAKNRGVRVEFFQNRQDALEWLNVNEEIKAASEN